MQYTTADFSFEIEGVEQPLRVLNFNGTEGLSQLFYFQLYLSAESDEINTGQIVGQPGLFTIENGPNTRRISGIVARFWFMGEVGGNAVYYADLVPKIWLLSQRFDCRIFQDKTVPEVIQEVVKEAGISLDYLDRKMLRTSYQAREYCVQYRESDFNFIARLMEEEGIYFYFEHLYDPKSNTGRHILVMADDPSCHKPIDGKATVIFHEPTGEVQEEEHVYEYHFGYQTFPETITLRDYDYTRPDLSLEGKAGKQSGSLTVFDYPGEFCTTGEANRIARVRFEEMQARTGLGSGKSNCCRFKPGYLFDLHGHGRDDCNAQYNLISVRHSGLQRKVEGEPELGTPLDLVTGVMSQIGIDKIGPVPMDKLVSGLLSKTGILTQLPVSIATPLGPLAVLDLFNNLKKVIDELAGTPDTQFVYSNEFICTPAETTYRAPRVTRKPAVPGPQTAVVVGPEGETLYMDELGRAKVKFHWDRADKEDEKRTCFIRVAYPYAGADHGIQFHPLVGDEVVVTFLEGDPDRPLITGVVYNGLNRPPLAPENRIENIVLTPYQHRLLLSDREAAVTLNTGGGEKVFLHDGGEETDFGKQIRISTADDHSLHLCKGKKVSGIKAETQGGKKLAMWDEPFPGSILLADKREDLKIWLNCDEEKILILNQKGPEIKIDCRSGNIQVLGGGVTVNGGQVSVDGSSEVSIKSGGQVVVEAPTIEASAAGSIKLAAPSISLEGAKIELKGGTISLDAPMVTATGVVSASTFTATTGVVSPSYSPGVGNLV